MNKSLIAALLLGAVIAPVAASAQEVPSTVSEILSVGAAVYGPDGSDVGKVESMAGGNVVIFTGANRATLPANSFGRNDKGLVISMTKEQLDSAVAAAAAKSNAALDGALVPGAEIKSSDGVAVGKVQKVDGANVIVDLAAGQAITLQKTQLVAQGTGLSLAMSAADLQAAVSAATAQTGAQ
jgi:hypothetical protein